jgi:hypothetical protein
MGRRQIPAAQLELVNEAPDVIVKAQHRVVGLADHDLEPS